MAMVRIEKGFGVFEEFDVDVNDDFVREGRMR